MAGVLHQPLQYSVLPQRSDVPRTKLPRYASRFMSPMKKKTRWWQPHLSAVIAATSGCDRRVESQLSLVATATSFTGYEGVGATPKLPLLPRVLCTTNVTYDFPEAWERVEPSHPGCTIGHGWPLDFIGLVQANVRALASSYVVATYARHYICPYRDEVSSHRTDGQ